MVHVVKTEPCAYCYGNPAASYAQNPRLFFTFLTQEFELIF